MNVGDKGCMQGAENMSVCQAMRSPASEVGAGAGHPHMQPPPSHFTLSAPLLPAPQAAELGDAACEEVWAAQSGADFDRYVKHGLSALGVEATAPAAAARAVAETDATAAVAAAFMQATSGVMQLQQQH